MQFIVKKINKENLLEEHRIIGYDEANIFRAIEKHNFYSYKIYDLSLPQANILKQTALSVGAECSLNKGVLISSVKKTDAILSGTTAQLKLIAEKISKQAFSMKDLAYDILYTLECEKKQNIPTIMGILNVTEDSFSDGGKYKNTDEAVRHALDMIENGAEIIDVGGESTRPNAKPVKQELECERVIPVIIKLHELAPSVVISIDTRNSETAKEGIAAGASIINDISGFSWDEGIVDIALKFNKKYVLTHSKNLPKTQNENLKYNQMLDNIFLELKTKSDFLLSKGFRKENIIIDPGFGFNKNVEENYYLLSRIQEFKSLGYKILAGVSRKSFLQELTDKKIDENLEIITAISSFYLAQSKIDYIRVHDIAKTKLALEFVSKLKLTDNNTRTN